MHRIHRPSWLLILLVLQLIWVQGLWAKETRYALVIGNSAYQNLRPLPNPKRDATAVADKLKGLGFTLIGKDGKATNQAVLDLDKQAFFLAVKRFAKRAGNANIALLYYAGHGMQDNQQSYLLPIDVTTTDIELTLDEGISLESILKRLDGKAGLTVAVFDACREIPELEESLSSYTRSVSDSLANYRGLGRVKTKGRSRVIAFSGAAGQLVKDGIGTHSPYTELLLAELDSPSQPVETLFQQVAWRFGQHHGGQNPEVLLQGVRPGHFFFIPAEPSAPGAQAIGPGGIPMQPNASQSIELLYWQSIESHPSAAGYESYLQTFPNGGFTALARARLADLTIRTETQQSRQSFEPEMVDIPGGSFRMGCVSGKGCNDAERPVHQVRIEPFKMGKYEVTQVQWRAVMEENPSKFKDCNDCPVEQVSWDDIQGYLEKLNRKTGKRYRLPSEAEWEYAARAGTSGPFSFSGKISSAKANYDSRKGFDGSAKGKYRKKTLPVGSFPANPWGLHDVHGNVKEWVEDCGNGSYTGAPSDGSAWQFGNCNRRVLRGGSWNSGPWNLRAARRYIYNPGYGYDNSGFRLAQD